MFVGAGASLAVRGGRILLPDGVRIWLALPGAPPIISCTSPSVGRDLTITGIVVSMSAKAVFLFA
jgi:hypothetical protein